LLLEHLDFTHEFLGVLEGLRLEMRLNGLLGETFGGLLLEVLDGFYLRLRMVWFLCWQ
jgi:hypothetical protein